MRPPVDVTFFSSCSDAGSFLISDEISSFRRDTTTRPCSLLFFSSSSEAATLENGGDELEKNEHELSIPSSVTELCETEARSPIEQIVSHVLFTDGIEDFDISEQDHLAFPHSSESCWNDEIDIIGDFLGWKSQDYSCTATPAEGLVAIDDSKSETILVEIKTIFANLADDIKAGKEPFIELNARKKRSCDGEAKDSKVCVRFKDGRFVRCLQIIHDLLLANVITTKRDIYYKDVDLFGNQRMVDKIIEDLAVHFGVARFQLNVVASSKGLIAGDIKLIMVNGGVIDCNQCSDQGVLICPSEQIQQLEIDCKSLKFVMVIEKACTFSHLLNAGFCKTFGPCVILTGRGYPDLATRQLLKRISNVTNAPILGLMDNDPYGLEILSIYKYGSKAMENSKEKLTVPRIEWLGLHCRDWHRFGISDDMLLPLADSDRKRGVDLLKRKHIRNETEWKKEISRVLWHGRKAELQALCSYDSMGMLRDYFPTKLAHPEEWL